VHFVREKALEGKYLIQSEEKGISPMEAVEAYKDLTEVEGAFRQIKDVIEMRPIYHRTRERVQAHIFVAALAFLLHPTLEKKLKAAKSPMSANDALKAMRTIHVVELQIADQQKQSITTGSSRARQVVSGLNIHEPIPAAPTNLIPILRAKRARKQT
jgi:transposase